MKSILTSQTPPKNATTYKKSPASALPTTPTVSKRLLSRCIVDHRPPFFWELCGGLSCAPVNGQHRPGLGQRERETSSDQDVHSPPPLVFTALSGALTAAAGSTAGRSLDTLILAVLMSHSAPSYRAREARTIDPNTDIDPGCHNAPISQTLLASADHRPLNTLTLSATMFHSISLGVIEHTDHYPKRHCPSSSQCSTRSGRSY